MYIGSFYASKSFFYFPGIGYFTLPYLIHAKADHVFACEWNPDAVSALRNNLKVNGVFEKCTVLEGDNRKVSSTKHLYFIYVLIIEILKFEMLKYNGFFSTAAFA